jgi:hypothetical protein
VGFYGEGVKYQSPGGRAAPLGRRGKKVSTLKWLHNAIAFCDHFVTVTHLQKSKSKRKIRITKRIKSKIQSKSRT